jgi:hypothetical protein
MTPDPLSFLTPMARVKTPRQPTALAQPAPAPGPSGIAKFLATPGIREAMMATGSALLAQADQRGNLAGALGRALPYGAEAFGQAKQRAAYDELVNQLPADTPPQMRAVLGIVDPAQGAAMLMDMMTAGGASNVVLPEKAQLRGPDGRLLAENTPEPEPEEQTAVQRSPAPARQAGRSSRSSGKPVSRHAASACTAMCQAKGCVASATRAIPSLFR